MLSCLEATGGFEPPNRGFADPRLRPLGYVASLVSLVLCSRAELGAEGETRTPTAKAATAPSTLRVYQFHHLGNSEDTTLHIEPIPFIIVIILRIVQRPA